MDNGLSTPEDSGAKTKRLRWVILALFLLLSLSFAIGYTMGSARAVRPIIIEKGSP